MSINTERHAMTDLAEKRAPVSGVGIALDIRGVGTSDRPTGD